MIRAWYTNGRPQAVVPPLGSFEEWASTVGSVLAFAGVTGFLGNLDQTQVAQDEDTQQWTAFFDAWWHAFGSAPVTVNDLCERLVEGDVQGAHTACALPDALLVHLDVHGARAGALRRSLGRHLSRLAERIFNSHKLLRAGEHSHRKVRCWKLSETLNPQTPLNPAANPAQQDLW